MRADLGRLAPSSEAVIMQHPRVGPWSPVPAVALGAQSRDGRQSMSLYGRQAPRDSTLNASDRTLRRGMIPLTTERGVREFGPGALPQNPVTDPTLCDSDQG